MPKAVVEKYCSLQKKKRKEGNMSEKRLKHQLALPLRRLKKKILETCHIHHISSSTMFRYVFAAVHQKKSSK